MLITLSQSHLPTPTDTLLATLSEQDVILLWQDGVYLGCQPTTVTNLFKQTKQIYALAIDLQARGLTAQLEPNITVIDLAQLVQLSVEHHPQLAY